MSTVGAASTLLSCKSCARRSPTKTSPAPSLPSCHAASSMDNRAAAAMSPKATCGWTCRDSANVETVPTERSTTTADASTPLSSSTVSATVTRGRACGSAVDQVAETSRFTCASNVAETCARADVDRPSVVIVNATAIATASV